MAFDWNQYQTADPQADPMAARGFDPSQRIENTGISGYGPGGIQAPGIDQAQPMPAAGSEQTWDQNYFTQNFGTPRTPQELLALEAKITAAGGKVLRNASGVAGKIETPDGRIIDVINSAGAGGNGFQWLDGGGGSNVNGSAGSTLGSLGYSFGSSMAPFTGQFAEPTADQALNSPGLQFALNQVHRMNMNHGAAEGKLFNGRFREALNASDIGNALQGYDNVYNRSLNTFNTNRDVFYQNQDRPFNKSLSLAQLGKPG